MTYTKCEFTFDTGLQYNLAVTSAEVADLQANAGNYMKTGGSFSVASTPQLHMNWAHILFIYFS